MVSKSRTTGFPSKRCLRFLLLNKRLPLFLDESCLPCVKASDTGLSCIDFCSFDFISEFGLTEGCTDIFTDRVALKFIESCTDEFTFGLTDERTFVFIECIEGFIAGFADDRTSVFIDGSTKGFTVRFADDRTSVFIDGGTEVFTDDCTFVSIISFIETDFPTFVVDTMLRILHSTVNFVVIFFESLLLSLRCPCRILLKITESL